MWALLMLPSRVSEPVPRPLEFGGQNEKGSKCLGPADEQPSATMDDKDRDALMRMAAFEQVRRLNEVNDHLTATELAPGFIFEGERVPLINPQRGIFKPQRMRYLLSIKTVFPKPCGKAWDSRPPPMTITPRLATLSILRRQVKCRQPRHLPITSTLTPPPH